MLIVASVADNAIDLRWANTRCPSKCKSCSNNKWKGIIIFINKIRLNSFSGSKKNLKSPSSVKKIIIIKPATILNSFEKKENVPYCRCCSSRIIKTNEKPNEKRIVFKTTDLSLSISPKSLPVIYEIYPGIIGNTWSKKTYKSSSKCKNKFKIILTLYLPLNFTDYNIGS